MLPHTPIVKAYRQLEGAVPTDGTGVQVVVSAPATAVDRVRAALQQAGAQAAGWPDVTQIAPAPRVSADRTVSVLTIGASVDVSDPRLPQLVARTRAEVVPAGDGRPRRCAAGSGACRGRRRRDRPDRLDGPSNT